MTVVVDTHLHVFDKRHETVRHRQWHLLFANWNINLKVKWFLKNCKFLTWSSLPWGRFFPPVGQQERLKRTSCPRIGATTLGLSLGIMKNVASEHFCSARGVRVQSKRSTPIRGLVKLLHFNDKVTKFQSKIVRKSALCRRRGNQVGLYFSTVTLSTKCIVMD